MSDETRGILKALSVVTGKSASDLSAEAVEYVRSKYLDSRSLGDKKPAKASTNGHQPAGIGGQS
jgi:hypothetical protein